MLLKCWVCGNLFANIVLLRKKLLLIHFARKLFNKLVKISASENWIVHVKVSRQGFGKKFYNFKHRSDSFSLNHQTNEQLSHARRENQKFTEKTQNPTKNSAEPLKIL